VQGINGFTGDIVVVVFTVGVDFSQAVVENREQGRYRAQVT